jgi:hypothetical protein
MKTTWHELTTRARARNLNGELLPLADGGETVAELRSLSIQLTGNCPCACFHAHCPFHLLSKLSPCSVRHLLETMPEADLRELFAMELVCRTIAAKAEPDPLDLPEFESLAPCLMAQPQ